MKGDQDSDSGVFRCSVSSLESPVLGESASMYRTEGEHQSFYHNLMVTTTSHDVNTHESHDVNIHHVILLVSSESADQSSPGVRQ